MKRYTKTEIRFVEEYYPIYRRRKDLKTLAARLGRSHGSLHALAYRLGITYREGS